MEWELTRVTEQIFDLLFSSGIGGFFIPDDAQKWVLREMRLASQKQTRLGRGRTCWREGDVNER